MSSITKIAVVAALVAGSASSALSREVRAYRPNDTARYAESAPPWKSALPWNWFGSSARSEAYNARAQFEFPGATTVPNRNEEIRLDPAKGEI